MKDNEKKKPLNKIRKKLPFEGSRRNIVAASALELLLLTDAVSQYVTPWKDAVDTDGK